MKHNDAELIERTLEGDQSAFAELVEKYQEQIHALAWQKIGDFHIAQEIAQDTFMTAYQKLSTLSHHSRFAGWLYVITRNRCKMWHRKKKPKLQSFDETDPMELEEAYYSDYVSRQREEVTSKNRRAIVRKLLNKLRESERTVVTMHYLAGLTCEEIGKFLGVSPNTVKSRLHRARERLKKEEAVIQENLSSFQLPTQMTENIMNRISQLTPSTTSFGRPFIPWVLSAASAILIVLLIGIGAESLFHVQKPFSLNAQSEPTIEITEARVIVDTRTEPTLRRPIDPSNVHVQGSNIGQSLETPVIDSEQKENGISKDKGKWAETDGPVGGEVVNLYATSKGDLYAGTHSGIYRLADDSESWEHINSRNIFSYREQLSGMRSGPMVERDDILYLATEKELLISTDRGVTWKARSDLPKGIPIGIVFSNETCYLCLTTGIYKSVDKGLTWEGLPDFDNEYKDISPLSIAILENWVFVGTDDGLYRLNGDTWEELFLDGLGEQFPHFPIISIEVFNNRIYVARHHQHTLRYRAPFEEVPKSPIHYSWVEERDMPRSVEREIYRNRDKIGVHWALFTSSDHGDTWENITPIRKKINKEKLSIVNLFNSNTKPKDDNEKKKKETPRVSITYSPLKIVATSDRLIVIDRKMHYYTTNSGENWYASDHADDLGFFSAIVSLNEDTHYRGGKFGIHRTTDAGKSWHQLNTGLVNTDIWQLIAVNGTLYANTLAGLVYSTNEGVSWTRIEGDTGYITRIVESDGKIYVRDDLKGTPRLFYHSTQDNRLIHISEIPTLEKVDPHKISLQLIRHTDDSRSTSHGYGSLSESQLGGIAVVNDTCYVEYAYQLFRWKPDTSEWLNTGLLDKGVSVDRSYCYANNIFVDAIGFRFAVSENTVYVGEKEGQLMRSLDEGLTWTDVTGNLPFAIDHFKAIAFAGDFVYVATDKGVVISDNGIDWHTLTDVKGKPIAITMFTVDGNTVYGERKHVIYRANSDTKTWQRVTPKIPYPVTCLDIDEDVLYVGTRVKGVLRYVLDKQ